jgi:hypothetical protein
VDFELFLVEVTLGVNQYTALSFSERLKEVDITPSILGSTGSALDNAQCTNRSSLP